MVPGTDLVWLGDRHSAIVDALEAGDADAAASVMMHHAREAQHLLADPPVGEAMVESTGSRVPTHD
jgi:DNA-binding GntR family transcriptional regulator